LTPRAASIPESIKRSTPHGETNAGRVCWVIEGSLCGGKIQGTYAKKLLNCWRCDFMNMVKQEEEPEVFGFSHTRLGMDRALESSMRRRQAAAHTASLETVRR
jgi:hypothetical protein